MLFLLFLGDVTFIFLLVLLVLVLILILLIRLLFWVFRNNFLTLVLGEFLIKNSPERPKNLVCMNYLALSKLYNGFGRFTDVFSLDEYANSLEIRDLVKVVINPVVNYSRTNILFIHALNQPPNVGLELFGHIRSRDRLRYWIRFFIKVCKRALLFASTFVGLWMVNQRRKATDLLLWITSNTWILGKLVWLQRKGWALG